MKRIQVNRPRFVASNFLLGLLTVISFRCLSTHAGTSLTSLSTTPYNRTVPRLTETNFTISPSIDYSLGDFNSEYSALVRNQTLSAFHGTWAVIHGRFIDITIDTSKKPITVGLKPSYLPIPEYNTQIDFSLPEHSLNTMFLLESWKGRSIFHQGKIISRLRNKKIGTLFLVSSVFDKDPVDLLDTKLLLIRATIIKKNEFPSEHLDSQNMSVDIWLKPKDNSASGFFTS